MICHENNNLRRSDPSDRRVIRPPKKPKTGHSDGQRSGDNARGHKPSGKNKKHVWTGKKSAHKSGQKRHRGNAATR